jgi:FAD/FMN-containing dehydrogenase
MNQIQRSGWGQNIWSPVNYKSIENFCDVTFRSEESGLAVGLGRSYGDSSLIENGISWRTESLNQISINPKASEAVCGSGVTMGELERESLRYGLFIT